MNHKLIVYKYSSLDEHALNNTIPWSVRGICEYEILLSRFCTSYGKRDFVDVIKLPNQLTLI